MVCFYYEIGLAVTHWAHVERALLEVIFATGMAGKNYEAMGHSFFAIQNFRSKLDFVEQVVVKSVRDARLLKEWPSLRKRCEQAAKKRAEIAHGYVAMSPTGAEPGRRMVLMEWAPQSPPSKISPNPGIPPSSAPGVKAIISYRSEFACLTYALENFASRIGGQPERHPKSLEQPTDPPSIETIASQIHEALGWRRPPTPPKKK